MQANSEDSDKPLTPKRTYEQKFCKAWLQDPRLSSWLVEQRESPFCKPCNKYLRNRKYTLLNHASSSLHQRNVESVLIEKCRICLADSDAKFMPSIYSKEVSTQIKIYKMINLCGGIRVIRSTEPRHICVDCLKKMLEAYAFRVLVRNSAKQYQNGILLNNNLEDDSDKFEHENNLDDQCIVLNDPQQNEDYPHISCSLESNFKIEAVEKSYGTESNSPSQDAPKVEEELDEITFKSETKIDVISHETNSHQDTFEELLLETIQSESEDEADFGNEDGIINNDEEEVIIEEIDTKTDMMFDEAVKDELNEAEKLFEARSVLNEADKLFEAKGFPLEYVVCKEPTKEDRPIYMCDLCGNQYNKPFKLKAHLKTHLNIKPFKCEICEKTFAVAGQVKAHMRTHTGEKPFPCQHCDRRFSDYGAKNRHQRSVHLHEKPYVCDECGKAFSYAATLKKHKRVHSGEKPHICMPCGKSFTEAHHLKTHCATIIHNETIAKLLSEETYDD